MSTSHAPTSGPTAFRSHWSAPPQHGHAPTGDMYDYDPNYQANNQARTAARNPPANQSSTQSNKQSTNTVVNIDGPAAPSAHQPVQNERAPLLGSGHGHSHGHGEDDHDHDHLDDRPQSNRLFGLFNSWTSLCCCLIPLLLLILLIVRFMMGDDHSADASVMPPMNSHHAIAAQCDPFNFYTHSVDLSNKHGIVAYLSVVPHDDRSHCKSVSQFEDKSERVNGTLFFSQLNTPTRLFTDRFVAHDTLEQSNNQTNQITLPSEFFFLDLHTRMLPPKKYRKKDIQLAIICDDGCTVAQESNKQSKKQSKKGSSQDSDDDILINNDGIHSTRFAAADEPLDFSDNEPINLSIKYFQGPPAHIALYMMYRTWRNESSNESDDDGNDLYWRVSTEPNVESSPTDRFNRLSEDEGWKVVPAEWFWLPKEYDTKDEVDALLANGQDPCNL